MGTGLVLLLSLFGQLYRFILKQVLKPILDNIMADSFNVYINLFLDYSLSLLFFSVGSIISYLIQSIDNGNTQLILISGIGIVLCVLWIIREPSKQPLIGHIIVTDL